MDVKLNPNGFPEIAGKILVNQERILNNRNKNRANREFSENEIIFVKSDRRKDANAYVKHVVKRDLGHSVLTKKDKIFHKDNIKNKKWKMEKSSSDGMET